MAKEFSIVNTDDGSGYIVKSVNPQEGQSLHVTTNFGQVVKLARQFFDETIVKGKKDGDSEPTPE